MYSGGKKNEKIEKQKSATSEYTTEESLSKEAVLPLLKP
jgi:hypothetical protein